MVAWGTGTAWDQENKHRRWNGAWKRKNQMYQLMSRLTKAIESQQQHQEQHKSGGKAVSGTPSASTRAPW
eukprot:11272564-Alexandrium_andersonii.AAC.1